MRHYSRPADSWEVHRGGVLAGNDGVEDIKLTKVHYGIMYLLAGCLYLFVVAIDELRKLERRLKRKLLRQRAWQ